MTTDPTIDSNEWFEVPSVAVLDEHEMPEDSGPLAKIGQAELSEIAANSANRS